MILEAGMLLCWVTASVQHCGVLGEHDVFRERVGVSPGDVMLSCEDGALPTLIRKFPDIIGLYDVQCSDHAEPKRETVKPIPGKTDAE